MKILKSKNNKILLIALILINILSAITVIFLLNKQYKNFNKKINTTIKMEF